MRLHMSVDNETQLCLYCNQKLKNKNFITKHHCIRIYSKKFDKYICLSISLPIDNKNDINLCNSFDLFKKWRFVDRDDSGDLILEYIKINGRYFP